MTRRVRWWFRRGFWTVLSTWKFRHAEPMVVPRPPDAEEPLRRVPMRTHFPEVPITAISVADRIPPDERQRVALLFCRFQAWLNRVASPMQRGLPEVDPNPYDAMTRAFSRSYRRCFRAPARPDGLERLPDLGMLAVASPYACYLTQVGDGAYEWDLTSLEGPEVQPGVVPPWARVRFELDAASRRPRPVEVRSALGVTTPQSQGWDESLRLATCAATTHLSLVRHWNWLHLIFGGPLAMATRNTLPGRHPLRRLLHPHVYATQSSNEFVTYVQMYDGGDFESIFSYTHRGTCELLESTRGGFDLRMLNPVTDVAWRGVRGLEVDTPSFDNRSEFLGLFYRHAARYLALYFDDDRLAADAAVSAWLEAVRAIAPAGLDEVLGPTVTIHGVAVLAATIIYMATVEHEIVDSGMWDYQLWPDANPVRIHSTGRRPCLDEYQRVLNFNFNFQTPRTQLMSDFSVLGLDEAGRQAFRRFYDDLATLQQRLATLPWAPWRIVPAQLKANINA
jgi:arachidonate 15-lipoxygenase